MSRQKARIALAVLLSLLIGFVAGVFIGKSRGIPFVKEQVEWSIGIYSGESPFDIASAPGVNNPVLSARDVTDVPDAWFVADPFMVFESGTWYMFFELLKKGSLQADIGLATSSDGFDWTYQQIVLDEPFHLSYPYVFKWQDEYYMVPETSEAHSVRIYKAADFPTKWLFVGTLLDGGDPADPSVFYYADRWWMFVETSAGRHDTLRLYRAQDLMGPWSEHPESPIVLGDANMARPAGRVVVIGDQVFRYAQDCAPSYGNQIQAFEITELTPTTYAEKGLAGNPILTGSGTGWNSLGMHHVDPHPMEDNEWIACVDGYQKVLMFGLEY